MTHTTPPKNRIWLDTQAISVQLKAMAAFWITIHPNLRRKHIGAALRKIATREIAPIYRKYALLFEGRSRPVAYKVSTSKKTGRTQRRKVVGNLRRSVGVSKLYPGYPADSAVDIKAGYRRGRQGGGHAMLLDEGTKPRFRKGKRTLNQALREAERVHELASKGVQPIGKRSRRRISAKRAQSGLMLSAKARFGYTGQLRPTRLGEGTASESANMGQVKLADELITAFNKAVKEQFSQKYQGIMNRYLAKYGGSKGLLSPTKGFFNQHKK